MVRSQPLQARLGAGGRRGPVSAEHAPHGRPMSPAADLAIAEAAIDMLAEVGFARLSMEGVAQRAGVSKATLYRRFASKEELVIATLLSVTHNPRDAQATATTTREALFLSLQSGAAIAETPSWQAVLGAVLGACPDDPLPDFLRKNVFSHSLAGTERLLKVGVTSGEVRPDVSTNVVMDILMGALVARKILGGEFEEDWVAALMDTIWHGIAATDEPATPRAAPSGGQSSHRSGC